MRYLPAKSSQLTVRPSLAVSAKSPPIAAPANGGSASGAALLHPARAKAPAMIRERVGEGLLMRFMVC
jgi:hypothetical protein